MRGKLSTLITVPNWIKANYKWKMHISSTQMLIKLLSVQYFDSTIFIIYGKKKLWTKSSNFEQKVRD